MSITQPFALFVGPTKSGTTWIHSYLKSRGDVALPQTMKETFFFDKVYDRGFCWYEDLFPGAHDTRLRVEVAPSLFHKPAACARVAKHIPEARIICTVRDPFDRAVSHFFHYRKLGAPKSTLTEMADRYSDVIEAGLYNRHATKWEEAFGQDKVYFMSYGLLRIDPDAFCRQLCANLEIEYREPDDALSGRRVNAAKVPRNLGAARMVQSVTTELRRRGGHRIVSTMKHLPIKQWLYSDGADLAEERKAIQAQSNSFSQALAADWAAFQTRDVFPDKE